MKFERRRGGGEASLTYIGEKHAIALVRSCGRKKSAHGRHRVCFLVRLRRCCVAVETETEMRKRIEARMARKNKKVKAKKR